VHNVGQKANLSQLCEPLRELKAWLKQWVLRRWRKVCDEEQAWMSEEPTAYAVSKKASGFASFLVSSLKDEKLIK